MNLIYDYVIILFIRYVTVFPWEYKELTGETWLIQIQL